MQYHFDYTGNKFVIQVQSKMPGDLTWVTLGIQCMEYNPK